jgi:hypothetical protein
VTEYLIVQAGFANRSLENLGVLLSDTIAGTSHRFRRDWDQITEDPEDLEYLEHLPQFLTQLSSEMGPKFFDWLEGNTSNFLRSTARELVMMDRPDRTLRRLYDRHIAPTILPFRTHLPRYTLRAAAGKFGESMEVEPEGWFEAPESLRLTQDMFAAYVTGKSMEPRIPDGSLCAFRANVPGSRQGKLLLVEHYGETGDNRYTIKRYRSTKRRTQEGWIHDEIKLEPLNPEYEAWTLEEGSPIQVRGEFLEVLE